MKSRLGQGIAALALGAKVVSATGGKAVLWGVEQTLVKEGVTSAMNLLEDGDTHKTRIWNAAHLDYLQARYDYQVSEHGLEIVMTQDASLLSLTDYLPKAAFEVLVENWSEAMGPSLGQGLGAIRKAVNITFVNKAIAKRVAAGLSEKAASREIFGLIKEMGWHGFVGEYWEEVLGATALQLAGEVTGDEEWRESVPNFFEPTNLTGLAIGLAVGGGGTTVVAGGLKAGLHGAVTGKAKFQTIADVSRSRGRVVRAGSGGGGAPVVFRIPLTDQANIHTAYRAAAVQAALEEEGLTGEDVDVDKRDAFLNEKSVREDIDLNVEEQMIALAGAPLAVQEAEALPYREQRAATAEGDQTVEPQPPTAEGDYQSVEQQIAMAKRRDPQAPAEPTSTPTDQEATTARLREELDALEGKEAAASALGPRDFGEERGPPGYRGGQKSRSGS